MISILDRIVKDKKREVNFKKSVISKKQLEHSDLFSRKTISLAEKLKQSRSGIIAEHKRRSPSKPEINNTLNVEDVAIGYQKSGVSGMSVLTNGKYFGGSLNDLLLARASCTLPLLRKEFIIDEYQIIESKSYGADAILLIAAILSKQEVEQFSKLAKSLDLDVLLEVHNKEELQGIVTTHIDMIGVNNRNLKTFDVSLNTSKSLSSIIPDNVVKVSESGIHDTETIKMLQSYGYQGFLIGENFMKTNDPGVSAYNFINAL